LPAFTATTDKEIDRFALRAREYFGITLKDQQDARDARAFYVAVRRKIEDKGILVLQDSFPREDGSGFCLARGTHPLIVIKRIGRRADAAFSL
jgi:Zn-dependent peptidase ImmA (M78 family)